MPKLDVQKYKQAAGQAKTTYGPEAYGRTVFGSPARTTNIDLPFLGSASINVPAEKGFLDMLMGSPIFQQIMSQNLAQTGLLNQNLRTMLGRAGASSTGLGAISRAVSGAYGSQASNNALAQIMQMALGLGSENLQLQAGLVGAPGEYQKKTGWETFGSVLGAALPFVSPIKQAFSGGGR